MTHVMNAEVTAQINHVQGNVEIFATEAALLANDMPNGTLAYATNTGKHFFRQLNTWISYNPASSSLFPMGTTQAFSVDLDPNASADPAVPSSPIQNQVSANAAGTFKTIAGLFKCLGGRIDHLITVNVPSGTYALLGQDFFGLDASHLTFGPNGQIKVVAATVLQVGPYALAGGAAQGFTLSANPGLTADQYKGYIARVVSGAGAGGHAIVRSHSGTTWTISGGWTNGTPDNTSQIAIHRPGAVFNLSEANNAAVNTRGPGHRLETTIGLTPQLIFEGVEVSVANSNVLWQLMGLSVGATLARFIGLGLAFSDGTFTPQTVHIDAANRTPYGVLLSGSHLRAPFTGGLYVRRATQYGIAAFGESAPARGNLATGFLVNTDIDECPGAGLLANGPSACLSIFASLRGISNGLGAEVSRGGRLHISSSGIFSTLTLTGSGGDAQIDGIVVPWATVNNDPDDFVGGPKGSYVGVP